MQRFFYQPPGWLRLLYPDRLWRVDTRTPLLYLSFDDGPHPEATPFVLDCLSRYGIKATFFCIGKNVERYPDLYHQLLAQGHRVGNHTYHHVNGWQTSVSRYQEEVTRAAVVIQSNLFRPPYGRLTSPQARAVIDALGPKDTRIVMWDLLSGDFDTRLSGEQCFAICKDRIRPGSVIVMHDSQKAYARMRVALPLLIDHALSEGYTFAAIP